MVEVHDAIGRIAGIPRLLLPLVPNALAMHSRGASFILPSNLRLASFLLWPPWESPNPGSQQILFIHSHLKLLWPSCSLCFLIILLFTRVHSLVHHLSGWSSPVPSSQPQISHLQHMTLSLTFLSRLRSWSENCILPPLATCRTPFLLRLTYFCTFAYFLFLLT